MPSERWLRAAMKPALPAVGFRSIECPDARLDALLDCIASLQNEDDPACLMAAVVRRLETWIPDAAVAIFRVSPDLGVPALSAAGHRWRSAERDAPGWLAAETSAVAMLVRSLDEIYGRLALAAPGVAGAALGAELLQVPLSFRGQTWGALTLVRPTATPLSTFERWLVHQVAVQFQVAWGHATERLELRALASGLRGAQERLLQRERLQALGRLASSVAHDVNNALTIIVGTAEYLLQDDDLAEPLRGDLGLVRVAAGDAVKIMAALRTFGSAGCTRNRAQASLDEIAQLSLELAEPALARATAPIETVVECLAAPLVAVDSEEIRHLLFRLVENAIEAMPGGGRVVVTVGETAGEPWVSVGDTGPGIDPVDRDRVFEPFYTTKDRALHRGLGLSECWQIADAHGGVIEVGSRPEGGATVTLRLPPAPSAGAEDPAISREALARRALRVLLVDDQPDVRESVGAMLTTLGHQVLAVAGGDQALAAARASSFDLVITDLGMPGLNGLDVARGIRTIAPGTPVVLLTGWGLAGGDRMPNDVSLVASKPVTLDSLSDTLERAMRRGPSGEAA